MPALITSVALPRFAVSVLRIMLSRRDDMRRIAFFLIVALSTFGAAQTRAQSDDPSEIFLKAYMTSQQGEKLEHESQFATALSKFRFAGAMLDDLRKRHGDWQPAIVEYRSRKVSESILRVQGKAGTQQELNATAQQPPESPSVLPQKRTATAPSVEISAPKSAAAPQQLLVETRPEPRVQAANDAAVQEATKKLREKVDQLEADLQKSRTQIAAAVKDKEALSTKLQATNGKLDEAHKELEKSKSAEKQVRDQLAQAEDSLKKVRTAGSDTKAEQALKGEIAQLKKALTVAEEGRTAAQKERDSESFALAEEKNKFASVARERDEAVEQVKGMKEAAQRVQTLVAENSDLKQKLADAEKTVRSIGEGKPQKEQELADVRRQVEQLRQQLATSDKQNKESETMIADLRTQLEDAAKQLETAKLAGASAEDTARLTKENQMLRAIVIRERQEEARRESTKKLMLAEFDKLKVKSDSLTEQVELLTQPITRLSPEELALLRTPMVTVSDDGSAPLKASFTYAKPATANSNAPAQPGSATDGKTASTPPGPASDSATRGVPEELAPLAREARQNFAEGKLRAAEKQYQEILTKAPNNLYSLSNLGVVYFRTGKLKAAELTLKKAVTVAPKDEFAHTTLGIVYYRQAKFDDALNELTKSLAINPKSASAHNYLGITASQKGWQEAAEKEMLEAISVNPDYADAHFNLAVVYATASPPSKEMAKKHYAKATQLGAEPDPSLEKLLH